MDGWYVAKVKPGKETGLISFLAQRDVEVFFPKIMEPGRNGPTLKPLFPTYMFCYLDPESSTWPMIRWAHGLAYFLTCDDEPVRVPKELIEFLQQQVSQASDRRDSDQFTQGDRVSVLGGPFFGLEGVFQRHVSGRQRCQILLEVVGRLTIVELPALDIQQSTPREPERCREGASDPSLA